MIKSRSLSDLMPEVQKAAEAHIAACASLGIELLVTSTYRDDEAQAALYAQGRTAPGKVVTNARPGESYHNHRIAYDVVIIKGGKCVWNTSDPDWATVGKLGESVGLEWAGRWKGSLKEFAHFQAPGYTLAKLRALRNPL